MPQRVLTLSLRVKLLTKAHKRIKQNAILIGQYKACAHFSANICFKPQTTDDTLTNDDMNEIIITIIFKMQILSKKL